MFLLILWYGLCKSISIVTQEIEFGREVESVALWYKRVVSLILWFDIINGQFVDPGKAQNVKKINTVVCHWLYSKTCFKPESRGTQLCG